MCTEIKGKGEVLLAIAEEDMVDVFATFIKMATLGSNGRLWIPHACPRSSCEGLETAIRVRCQSASSFVLFHFAISLKKAAHFQSPLHHACDNGTPIPLSRATDNMT